jgi:hypothetical protein
MGMKRLWSWGFEGIWHGPSTWGMGCERGCGRVVVAGEFALGCTGKINILNDCFIIF